MRGSLRYKPQGKDKEETHHNLIVAIDPTTGKWQRITDDGYAGRVSPDRQTLAFCREEEIWSCNTGGADGASRISDHSGLPIWSPDGKHLVATKQEFVDGHWKDETWRVDAADGANPVRLPISDTDSVKDWSPDGQWFVTCSDRHPPHGRGYQLYVVKTDGTQQRRITEGGLNCLARFAPDGQRIAYTRQTAEGNSLWVVDTDGKNPRQILQEINLVAPGGACWSPDGKQLAVWIFNWELDEKGRKWLAEPANFRIEILDADGQNRRELKLADARWKFIGSLDDWR